MAANSTVGDEPPFRVAFLVFPGITQLDLTGPQEVFARVRGAEIHLYWKSRDPVTSASGLQLVPTRSFADLDAPDLLCVPGGPGQVALMSDDETLAWVRTAAQRARWLTSVCTGSLVLAAAGLLEGRRATTHWSAMTDLALLGAIPVAERVVIERELVTGAGVTSGIDFALRVVAELFGPERAQGIALSLEYAPAPPWPESGSPARADPAVLERVRAALEPFAARRREATLAAARRLGRCPR